jgi:threonine dehydrogenase-like Zn-dependent dehydrogenase
MKALLFDLTVPKLLMLQILQLASRKFYYEGPFAMVKLADVPEPQLPSPEWVKIRTRLCGFCGSDSNLIQVKDSVMGTPFTSFPCIFGHEFCGEVVEAGKDVQNCKTGDLVAISPQLNCTVRGIIPECRACTMGRPGNCENFAEGRFAPGMFSGICKDVGGGFAEYLVAHRSQVFRVPDGVSPEAAVLTEPLAVGLQAVLDNRPSDREKVLIIGGGVIGAMIVKAIRGLDIHCDITVVEPSSFAAEYVKKSGADHVLAGGIIEAAEKNAGGRAYKPMLGERILQGGFARVYDTVGHSPTLQAALIVTAACGTVSLVGIGKRLKFDPTPLWLKLLTVKGAYGYGYNETGSGRKHAFAIALELMEKKKVYVNDMLTHTFPIERYRDLIEVNFNKGKNRAIKTAISF